MFRHTVSKPAMLGIVSLQVRAWKQMMEFGRVELREARKGDRTAVLEFSRLSAIQDAQERLAERAAEVETLLNDAFG